MKMNKYLSVVVCIFFMAVLLSPGILKNSWGQGNEGKAAVEEKPEGKYTTKEKFSEEKKEFEAKAKARLDDLDKKIDQLEAESKKAGSKVKEETKEGLRELKEKSAALKKEMKKLKAKSKTKWEEAKQKIQAGGDELEEAYNKVRAKFNSE
jgi:small-conductance mechanosensitive channel